MLPDLGIKKLSLGKLRQKVFFEAFNNVSTTMPSILKLAIDLSPLKLFFKWKSPEILRSENANNYKEVAKKSEKDY